MPTYNVKDPTTGKTITLKGETPPTEQELEDIFSQVNAPSASSPAEAEQPKTTETGPVVDFLNKTGITKADSPLQAAAQVGTSFIRGGRGIGVGLQKATHLLRKGRAEPGEFSDVLHSAAQATRPGYVPQGGEKIGSALGQMAAVAPALAAATPSAAAGLVVRAAAGGLSSGALTALQDASDRGEISLVGTGISTATGAMLPMVAPTAKVVARAIRGATRTAATSGTTLSRDAAEEAMNDPQLLKQYEGTAKAVGDKVVKIQQALVNQHQRVSGFLDKVRERIGFREPFSDSLKRLENEGFQENTIQDIVKEYRVLRRGKMDVELIGNSKMKNFGAGELSEFEDQAIGTVSKARDIKLLPAPKTPSTVQGPESISTDFTVPGLPGMSYKTAGEGPQFMAKEGPLSHPINRPEVIRRPKGKLSSDIPEPVRVKTVKNDPTPLVVKETVQIPDKLRLRELYRLRQKLDHFINFPKSSPDVPSISNADDHVLKTLRTRVNTLIENIPGGKTLRMADKAYSLSRELYDDLQKKLATQGQAEEVIQRVLKGGNASEIIGRRGDTLRLISDLERKTKQSLLGPVRKELAAKNLREMKATGFSGIPAEALGVEGTARALRYGENTARFLENPMNNALGRRIPRIPEAIPRPRPVIQSLIDVLVSQ